MKRPLLFCAALLALALPAAAQDTTLTTDQEAWLEELRQNPARVERLMELEMAQIRMKHWEEVSAVAVTGIRFATGINNKEPFGEIRHYSTGRDTPLYVWISLETPKDHTYPLEVQFKWYHTDSDPDEPKRVQTVTVTQASPHWRTWDAYRPRKAGTWMVTIEHEGRVLEQVSTTIN